MVILFSPIGGSDPIRNGHDGPMLHIVRHYKPEVIAFYYTKEMYANETADQRYTQAIDKLCEGWQSKPEVLSFGVASTEEEKGATPHLFDQFYDEFQGILQQLQKKYKDAEIIVNVSSGTPAMQQALVTLAAFGAVGKLKAVEVPNPTPKQGKNFRDVFAEKGLDMLWASNEDNNLTSENRCAQVKDKNLHALITRDNICELVKNYDYEGAFKLGEPLRDEGNENWGKAVDLIEGCTCRMKLDRGCTRPYFEGTGFQFRKDELVEYLLMLEVYFERKQWADFLRAMTPAVFETLRRATREKAVGGIKESKWTSIVKCGPKKGCLTLEPKKIKPETDIYQALKQWTEKKHPGKPVRTNGDVSSWHFAALLDYFVEDERVKIPYLSLRNMEENARNAVAHRIVAINELQIEEDSGITFEQALAYLFMLNGFERARGLYGRINKEIIRLLA